MGQVGQVGSLVADGPTRPTDNRACACAWDRLRRPPHRAGAQRRERDAGLALADDRAARSEPATLDLLCARSTALVDHEDGLAAVVIGWPRRLDGTATHSTAQAEALARALEGRLSIPVVLQDERLSSHEAESRLSTNERDWRQRKSKLDAAAAAVVLQDYLDHRPR